MSLTAVAAPNYLAEARRVLAEIEESDVRCTRDFIDPRELGKCETEADFAKYLDQFGFRYLRYFQFSTEGIRANLAVTRAAESIGCRNQVLVATLAQTKFNITEDNGLSYLAYSKLPSHLPTTMLMITSAPARRKEVFPEDFLFHFLLVGVHRDQVGDLQDKNPDFIATMDALTKTDGVILDCLHKIVCPISAYKTDATALLEYAQKKGIRRVWACVSLGSNAAEVEATLKPALLQAETVYTLAKTLLPQVDKASLIRRARNCFCSGVDRLIPSALKPLQEAFPQTTWERRTDRQKLEWAIWTQGPERVVQPIAAQLKALGTLGLTANKVKNKDAYAIILKNPDATQLRVQFAVADIFDGRRFVGPIAAIIASYAEK